MVFDVKNFSRCRFNPCVEKGMVKAYKELGDLPLVPEIADQDNLLRYIVAIYDDNTPLNGQYESNIGKRKMMAIEHFGLDHYAEDIINLNSDGLISLISDFMFKYCKQRTWVKIAVNEQLFQEYSKRLLQPVASTKFDEKAGEKDELQAYQIKAKLREELDSIGDSLEKYYREMFHVDEVLTKKQRRSFTPEAMATAEFG